MGTPVTSRVGLLNTDKTKQRNITPGCVTSQHILGDYLRWDGKKGEREEREEEVA